ncbi:HYAL4 protein, partial [Polypterus senegalus]|nr:HYAL4 protein [Polypterus senegalus]
MWSPGVYREVLTILVLLAWRSVASLQVQAPLLPGQPFLVFWGIPNDYCQGRPDPSAFSIVANGTGHLKDGGVTVFYENDLGLYPYFGSNNQPVCGGLPQLTNLEMHLLKSEGDIKSKIPSPEYHGLAIINWDKWWPNLSHTKIKRIIYQDQSRAILEQFFPDWSLAELNHWAEVDFDSAAQSIMVETILQARTLRPKGLWGFSSYPTCHNSNWKSINSSGGCTKEEVALNDHLSWMWAQSCALYPSLQVNEEQSTSEAHSRVTHQILEAIRVANMAEAQTVLPVFPLLNILYSSSSSSFLSQADLENTIGESAALGVSGVVLWQKLFSTQTQRHCWGLSGYLRKTLGPYVVNVTTAARLCSVMVCRSRGRCVRKNPEELVYLHLPPDVFQLTPEDGEVGEGTVAQGQLHPQDVRNWKDKFKCQWFVGLTSETGYEAEEQEDEEVEKPFEATEINVTPNSMDGAVTLGLSVHFSLALILLLTWQILI